MTLQRWLGRVRYILERLMIRGPHYQLLLVAMVIGLIALAGGSIVLMGANDLRNAPDGTGGFNNIGDAVWWAFLRMTDPGYLGDDDGVLRRIVSTMLTLIGYVVFLGALIAIMTRWLLDTMRKLESGVTPVAAKNHVAIIGWTGRTPALVAELLCSEGRVKRFLQRHGARKLQIAILAEEIGPERMLELRERAGDVWKPRQVTLRSGSSLRPDHLERIDFLNASAVLIPADDSPGLQVEDVDSRTIKSLLSLGNHPDVRHGLKLPFAAVEVRDARKIPIAQQAYPGEIEVIASDATISRLMAQNIRHPGLSHVYNELLTHSEGSSIYIRDAGVLANQSIDVAVQAYTGSVLLGVVRPTDDSFMPFINPPGSFVIQPHDRLVVMASSYEDADPNAARASAAASASSSRDTAPAILHAHDQERRILILGWNHKLPSLIAEFASYADERYAVDTVSVSKSTSRENEVARYGASLRNVTLRHIEADYNHLPELRAIEPWQYDHIILVGSGRMATHEDADARTLQGYLLLQHMFAEPREDQCPRPRILVELLDPENFGLLAGRPGELLISPMIVSHMLAQVALRRELRAVFEELFTVGGAEITFHSAARYGVAGKPLTFAALQQVVWSTGETLIGVYQHNETNNTKPILNPPGDSEWKLNDHDELITIMTVR